MPLAMPAPTQAAAQPAAQPALQQTAQRGPTIGASLQRAFTIERSSVDREQRTVIVAFASERPVQRWWGSEVLRCVPGHVRIERLQQGAAALVNHDTDDHVGVVEEVMFGVDRVLRARLRFGHSARAQEIWADVVDGIRRNASVTYLIHDAAAIPGGADGEDVEGFIVTDWEPLEISIVSIPADPGVGVGRSAPPAAAQPPVTPAAAAAPQPQSAARAAAPVTTVESSMPANTDVNAGGNAAGAPVIDLVAERAQASAEGARAAREAAAAILAIGAQFRAQGGEALAAAAVAKGQSVDAFRADLMQHIATRPTATNDIGMTQGETQRYSLLRAIRAMVDRDWSGAGLEREASEAVARQRGVQPQHGGFFMPPEVQHRSMVAGTPAAGGNLVDTSLRAASFIELLRARARVVALGAQFLPGLVGNLAIPRMTAAATATWLATEATAATLSAPSIGQVAMAPRNIAAYTEISRQLLMQSTPAADALVSNDLARVLALGIDLAALNGSGAAGQPRGIINTAGIHAVAGTTLGYPGVVEFQTDLAGASALTETCAYLTTPSVAGLLMQRQRFTSTDSPLWSGSVLDGQVGGFRATSSTQVPAANMLFGDFSQIIIGEWGLLEIAMNPYANFQAAITGIRAIQSVDIAVRHASAFALATAIT